MSLERQTRKSELYCEIDAQEFRPVSQLFCDVFFPQQWTGDSWSIYFTGLS